jgi:DNA polymerase III alpha subunit
VLSVATSTRCRTVGAWASPDSWSAAGGHSRRRIIFLLLEDEYGMVNVLVSRELVEAQRDLVRTAPFVRVTGTLEERAGEQRTLIAESIAQIFPAEVLSMPAGKSWG